MPFQMPQIGQGLPTQAVPIPGQAQPLQLPQRYDPAQIIMQAAQLRQQQDLEQQKINQNALQNTIESIQGFMSLAEKRRESEATEKVAQATLKMHQDKLAPEEALLKAHTAYFNAQASGGEGAVEGAIQMLKTGMATPQDIYTLSGRWKQNDKERLVARLAQEGLNLKSMGFDVLETKKTIEFKTGSAAQQRVRGGESILPNFQTVVNLAKKLDLSAFAPANKIKLMALRQINDPDVAKYDTTRAAVSEEMARYFGGGTSSDRKIVLGQNMLGNDGANGTAIEASLLGNGGAYEVIDNQVKSFGGPVRDTNKKVTTRILKNGQQIEVIEHGDGTFEQVE